MAASNSTLKVIWVQTLANESRDDSDATVVLPMADFDTPTGVMHPRLALPSRLSSEASMELSIHRVDASDKMESGRKMTLTAIIMVIVVDVEDVI